MVDLISIIVPVYNVEQYLNRCVESIVGQSYQNLEIILVEDGSPDMCSQICDDWAKKDNRIKVIHKENGGLSDARNVGMRIASGNFIGFVDSDDWIAPEMYEKLIRALKQDKSDIAACTVQMVWGDDSPSRLLTVQENIVLNRKQAQQELLCERKLKQPVWYKLYRREVVENIPFEKGKYHEDVFWSYQAIGIANKVSIIDYVGYYYWQREGSIMGESFSTKRLDAMEGYCRRYEYIKKRFPELEVQARVAVFQNCIYFGQMALQYMNRSEQKQMLNSLNKIKSRYSIKMKDIKGMRTSHKVWCLLARVSLRTSCVVKNMLGVGI